MPNERRSSSALAPDWEEINLRELVEAVLRHKALITLLTLVAIAIAYLPARFSPPEQQVHTVIAMNFKGINEGTYPSGRPFNASDIVSSLVLSQVVQELGLEQRGISVSQLQRAISVEGIASPPDLKTTEKSAPVTTPVVQYRIKVNGNDLPGPLELKHRIVGSLVEKYRESRLDDLLTLPLVPKIASNLEEFLRSDYSVVSTALGNHLSTLRERADLLAVKTGDFVPAKQTRSFVDLANDIHIVQEAQYDGVAALIQSYRLTRDKQQAIMRYRSLIRDLELAEKQAQAESQYTRQLLIDAQALRDIRITGELPIVTGADGKNPAAADLFSRLYTGNLYSQLVERAVGSGVKAVDARSRIQTLREQIDRLTNDPVDEAFKRMVTAQVDQELQSLALRLNELTDTLNEMTMGYYGRQVRVQIPYVALPQSTLTYASVGRNAVLAGGLTLSLCVFVLMAARLWRVSAKERTAAADGQRAAS